VNAAVGSLAELIVTPDELSVLMQLHERLTQSLRETRLCTTVCYQRPAEQGNGDATRVFTFGFGVT